MTLQEQLRRDRAGFAARFGAAGAVIWAAAPGRVNLIGEHTDYHEGLVLPVAIDRYVRVLGAPSGDPIVRVVSASFDDEHRFELDEPMGQVQGWARRAEGILRMVLEPLRDSGGEDLGLDLWIDADLPGGGGLSSSAASMAALGAVALRIHADPGEDGALDRVAYARTLQQAEHRFAGLRCGPMDQLAVLLGRAGHALLLDCRSLETHQVPLPAAWAIVVLDTGVKHDLASSEYNQRQIECAAVFDVLRRQVRPQIAALRDVDLADLEVEAVKAACDPVGIARCRHVVEENERVNQAVAALVRGDRRALGRLFRASHESLRDLYSVSCPELDALAEAAWETPRCIAARMTGGGFGGSTVNLVQRREADAFVAEVLASYRQRTGLDGRAILATSADGLTAGSLD